MIIFKDDWCVRSAIADGDWEQFSKDEAYFIAKYHERREPVIPKAGSFWIIDHWEPYGHADANCEKCGTYFPKHYSNEVLCGNCRHRFQTAYYALAEYETNKRFKAQQEAYKNRNKPIQLTIKLDSQ